MRPWNEIISNPRVTLAKNKPYGNRSNFLCGSIYSPYSKRCLTFIASIDQGKVGKVDHVSVSYPNRMPTWDEMCFVKEIFFKDSEEAYQVHPKKSEYVNTHEYCLHIWRPHYKTLFCDEYIKSFV